MNNVQYPRSLAGLPNFLSFTFLVNPEEANASGKSPLGPKSSFAAKYKAEEIIIQRRHPLFSLYYCTNFLPIHLRLAAIFYPAPFSELPPASVCALGKFLLAWMVPNPESRLYRSVRTVHWFPGTPPTGVSTKENGLQPCLVPKVGGTVPLEGVVCAQQLLAGREASTGL